jgi:Mn2+/Fe2+ NRAMP family transporter
MFSLSAVVMVLNSEVADIRLLPSAPSDRSEWIVLALIGTTVVPYNLFLHASLVQRKWADGVPLDQAISAARRDLAISLAIGGIVTIAVMVTAAYLYRGGAAPSQLSDLPAQLAPVAGPFAEMAFALGLLAAGLSSALTAPLAASLTLEGAFHRDNQPSRRLFRSTWALVLLCGAGFAVTSQQPVELILIAQVTNALLLPLLALILIVLAARTSIMGQHASRAWQSGVAVLAAMVCGYLSVQRFL